jgi:transposase-like protein
LAAVPEPLPAKLLTKAPKSAQPRVATQVRTIFDQPTPEGVHAQHGRVVATLEAEYRDAAAHLDEAKADLLVFTDSHARSGRTILKNDSTRRSVNGGTPSENTLAPVITT